MSVRIDQKAWAYSGDMWYYGQWRDTHYQEGNNQSFTDGSARWFDIEDTMWVWDPMDTWLIEGINVAWEFWDEEH